MVTGDRLITIRKGDDSAIQIDIGEAPAPAKMSFSCASLSISKELEKIDDSFVLELTSDETNNFSEGIYDYDMTATYEDGTTDTFIIGGKLAIV